MAVIYARLLRLAACASTDSELASSRSINLELSVSETSHQHVIRQCEVTYSMVEPYFENGFKGSPSLSPLMPNVMMSRIASACQVNLDHSVILIAEERLRLAAVKR